MGPHQVGGDAGHLAPHGGGNQRSVRLEAGQTKQAVMVWRALARRDA
ncbi:MAG: hypothetical protein K6T86_03785 [Pirellulales bacterium]|nr:hypothetical protein [Pirellulales bacterium]